MMVHNTLALAPVHPLSSFNIFKLTDPCYISWMSLCQTGNFIVAVSWVNKCFFNISFSESSKRRIDITSIDA
eukprot:7629523-Ditylum_brightwellii.AAC.1